MSTLRLGLIAPGSASVSRVFFTAIALAMAMTDAAEGGPAPLLASPGYYEAAVRGDPDAQANLAASYARGDGVQQSDAYAFQWGLRAAGQGHPRAQLMLSGLFANGRGVPKDSVTAYKWASVAAANAREPETLEKAIQMIRHLAGQLTDAEIAAARARAADWKPRYEFSPLDPPASQQVQLDPPGVRPNPGAERKGRSGSATTLSAHIRTARGMAYRDRNGASRVRSCRCQVPARLLGLARRWGR